MRNGFQLKKENDGGFGLDDDKGQEEDKLLRKLAETLSITGDMELMSMKGGTVTPELGVPNAVGFLATGSLAENTPIWVGADISSSGAEVHRYTIARTNILDSSYVNLRAGTLDPTTWTSFYGHSGALDTPSGDIGAYGGGHHGAGANFTQVGPGYAQHEGIEFYGYNDWLLLSAGLANGEIPASDTIATDGHAHADTGRNYDRLDYWATGRLDFAGSSASLLWYNANGSVEKQVMTAAFNVRYKNLDLRSQFSLDVSKHSADTQGEPRYGFTFQADYKFTKKLLGIYRYDTTDNGENSGVESQMTFALVLKPAQNIKLTTSYIYEQDVAVAPHDDTGTSGDHAHMSTGFGNHVSVTLRYML
ncbi:MAG: hypothetical protein OEZ43_12530 [Gammaproteobacteria bacterium]|nr:hypothetical protein [Gammaproteobacteria bacterium]